LHAGLSRGRGLWLLATLLLLLLPLALLLLLLLPVAPLRLLLPPALAVVLLLPQLLLLLLLLLAVLLVILILIVLIIAHAPLATRQTQQLLVKRLFALLGRGGRLAGAGSGLISGGCRLCRYCCRRQRLALHRRARRPASVCQLPTQRHLAVPSLEWAQHLHSVR
jgi:hypothetical protein